MSIALLAWILGILFLISAGTLWHLHNRPKTAAENREYALTNNATWEDRVFAVAATIATLSGAGFIGVLIALANAS